MKKYVLKIFCLLTFILISQFSFSNNLKNNITKNIPVDIDKVNRNKFSLSPKLSKNKSTVITPGQGQSPKTIEKPKIFFTFVSWQCSQLLFLKTE